MANASIFAAFERMWQHVLAKFDEFGNKTISVDVPQAFTNEQKEQARANLGITSTGSGDSTILTLLTGSINDITPGDVIEAINDGKAVILSYYDGSDTLFFTNFNRYHSRLEVTSTSIKQESSGYILYELFGDSGGWEIYSHYVITSDTPILEISKGGTGQSTIEDTAYTTPRYRASALVSTETNPTTNGVINWVYE